MLQDEDASQFIQELEDEHSDEYDYYYMEDPYFYEKYMYVDATMAGADSPHYICSENLSIRKCHNR